MSKKETVKSAKLEMTDKQLRLMVWLLSGVDLRNDPEVVEIALDLRKKMKNALDSFEPKPFKKTDKYGKPIQETNEGEAQQAEAPQEETNGQEDKAGNN